MKQTLKTILNQGKQILGVMIQDFLSPIVLPSLKQAGFDFVVIDQEHGPAYLQDIQNFVLSKPTPEFSVIVRVSTISYENIARVLDMGADGLMIPHVDTIEQLQEVIRCAKYPPLGERSYGMRGALAPYSIGKTRKEYIRDANEHTILFIQIETPSAVKIARELSDYDAIDGVIMGPADFTMNMGKIGEFEHPQFEAAAQEILDQCQQSEKGFGIHFGELRLTKKWQQKGMNILLFSSVMGFIKQKAAEINQEIRKTQNQDEEHSVY